MKLQFQTRMQGSDNPSFGWHTSRFLHLLLATCTVGIFLHSSHWFLCLIYCILGVVNCIHINFITENPVVEFTLFHWKQENAIQIISQTRLHCSRHCTIICEKGVQWRWVTLAKPDASCTVCHVMFVVFTRMLSQWATSRMGSLMSSQTV